MGGLLDGARVLDLTEGVDGYAAKLMADFGAEITKIERPGGDPTREFEPFYKPENSSERSAFFSFLNTNKETFTLNPSDSTALKSLKRLIEGHHVVIENWLTEFGPTPDEWAQDVRETTIVSLHGFGTRGPRSSFESTELIEAAMGGLLYISGLKDRPPTKPPCHATSFLASSYAAIGAMSGLLEDLRYPNNHIDISKQECIASQLEQFELDYPLNGNFPQRNGNTHNLGHPMGEIYEAEDGYVCVCLGGAPFTNDQGGTELSMWPTFCELLDREDLLSDERFNPLEEEFGPAKRRQYADELDPILNGEIQNWKKNELFLEAQNAGLTVSRVSTSEDVVEDEQLQDREFLTRLQNLNSQQKGPLVPSSPFHLTQTSIQQNSPEDRHSTPPAETNPKDRATGKFPSSSSHQSISDLRVLDFTRGWSGPFCTQVLGDLGADVIKVETPKQIDPSRKFTPSKDNYIGDPLKGEDHSAYFQKLNRGKRGLGLDFKKEEGQKLVKGMVREGYVDVIVENFTGGTLQRAGLGYQDLKEANSSLIMCSLSGFGQNGPYRKFPMYGPNVQAHAGVTKLNGFPDDPPVRMGISFADPFSGIHATFSILSALIHKNQTGNGEYIDLAQLETGALVTHKAISTFDLSKTILNGRGNRDPEDRFVQGVYRCQAEVEKDSIEGWIAIVIRDEDDWVQLREQLGQPDWVQKAKFQDQVSRRRHHDEFDEHLEEWTQDRNRYEIMEQFQEAGIPAGVVQTTADLYDRDEHLMSRDFWSKMDHPLIPTIPYPGPIPSVNHPKGEPLPRAPFFAENTQEIATDLGNYDDEKVEQLLNNDVLFTTQE